VKGEPAGRETCEVEVEVRCLVRPVHSGQKGGPVPDPVQVLCRLIADLRAGDGGWLRVVGFESQPVRGAANTIVDVARARLVLRAPGGEARPCARRLIRRLSRDPPFRAHVRARVVA
jgi:hypothetical protein